MNVEEEIIKWGAYVLAGLIGAFVKVLWDAVTELKNDLHKIEVGIVRDFVSKDEVAQIFSELMRKLERIEDYLLKDKGD